MKTIHLLNSGLFYLMLGIYAMLFLAEGIKGLYVGLVFQTFLGIAQVIFSIVLLARINTIPQQLRKLLILYFIITTITLILVFTETIINSPTLLIIIPMSIATYFVYVTNSYKTIRL